MDMVRHLRAWPALAPLLLAPVFALSAPTDPASNLQPRAFVDRPLVLFSTHGQVLFMLTYKADGVMDFVEVSYLVQPEDKRPGSRHGSRRWLERSGQACHHSKGYLTCFDLSRLTTGSMQRAPGKALTPDGKVLEEFLYEGTYLSRDDYLP